MAAAAAYPAQPTVHGPGPPRSLPRPLRPRRPRRHLWRRPPRRPGPDPRPGPGWPRPQLLQPTRVAAPTEPGLPFDLVENPDVPHTAFGWPIVPDALRQLLVGLWEFYGKALPPVTITENGCSVAESSTPDQPRIDFMASHLEALAQAVAEGVDVRGYYTWSILDNFEWEQRFNQRFGLVHVDFESQRRTPRASYAWYRDLIAAHKARHTR
ncbi:MULTISPECIES: family 1 glycosylhydrolase [unclassified Kitasatospora]|uniref:family 1 glycosylhydrolase n=1 Tax=unclassified Kitasatospora TaxID=2633591 RepID=UPI0033EE7916